MLVPIWSPLEWLAKTTMESVLDCEAGREEFNPPTLDFSSFCEMIPAECEATRAEPKVKPLKQSVRLLMKDSERITKDSGERAPGDWSI